MKSERSAGIIPVRIVESEIRYFLIQHLAGHWGFPKGHHEEGESDLEAAVREFKEETGLDDPQILRSHPFEERYVITRDDIAIDKCVKFFLAVAGDGSPSVQKSEIQNCGWFNFEQAFEKITYTESQKVLVDANLYLKMHPLITGGSS
ncbi:MAG: NUDIX domain-containing protein [Candidatus Omnitrophica bacterium]|nr:NUDIX domain-containing protein [Candidatus Omnitrophota bacterium]